MFPNVLKALLFCSAMLFVVDASSVVAKRALELERPAELSLFKRQGGAVGGAVAVTDNALVKAWAAVNVELNTCQSVLQQTSITVEVAIKAVAQVSALIQTASQSTDCGCSSDNGLLVSVRAQLQVILTTFFSNLQIILQIGSKTFSDVWGSRFKDVFQTCSSGFTAIVSICASLQIDLKALLASVNLDASLFAAIGLDISGLLQAN